jgi:general transcription factor 3C polypeptide 5 (transcription factor C subunit 1)
VEFPGYIKNEDKALATFGGLDGLSAQRLSHPKTLQLRLRPGDPSCHPLISDDAKPTTVLLLKLTRRSSAGKSDAATKPQAEPMQIDSGEDDDDDDGTINGVKAEIVAVADKTYAFSAPADFQYAGQDRRPFEVQWVARPDRVDDDPEFLPKQPLLCTPSIFAVEPAVDYAFKQYKAADFGLDVLGRKPKRGMGITWVDYFASGVPSADTKTIGTTGVVGDTTTAAGNNVHGGEGGQRAALPPGVEALVSKLEMLFSQRPVYLESALGAALGALDRGGGGSNAGGGGASTFGASSTFTSFPATRSQQELLSKLCYRFKNGPWKGTWVLRGYDPRAEPAAREYQVLEYSLPVEWWKKVLTHKNRVAKQLQQLHLHSTTTVPTTATANTSATATATTAATPAGGSATAPGLPPVASSYTALCSFSGVQSTQTLQLQLCDVDDAEIQSELAESSNVAGGVTDGSGWLTQPAWEGIKTKVAARFGALWEAAAAAQAAEIRGDPSSVAGGVGGSGNTTSIGIIPPELMSELTTYLEKGHPSKASGGSGPGAAAGAKSQGAAEDLTATVQGQTGSGGEATGAGGSGNGGHVETVEDDDDDDDDEEVEVEEDEEDDDDDGEA